MKIRPDFLRLYGFFRISCYLRGEALCANIIFTVSGTDYTDFTGFSFSLYIA